MRFFEPDSTFLDWLASYAGKRLVFDVGCGDGDLVLELQAKGVKAMGIDPIYLYQRVPTNLSNCIFPAYAEECGLLRKYPALVLFCRPCHSGFVERTLEVLHRDSEAVYVSKPENVIVDLSSYKTQGPGDTKMSRRKMLPGSAAPELKLVFFQIQTWVGFGGRHYYGNIDCIKWHDPYETETTQVEKQLTASEARQRNKEQRDEIFKYTYKKGDLTGQFDTKAELRKAAIKTFKEKYSEGYILLEGSRGTLDPRTILAGPEDFMKRGNDIVAKCEAIGWWDGGKNEEMENLSDDWKQLLKEYNVQR